MTRFDNPMDRLFETLRPVEIDNINAALIVVDMQLSGTHRDWGEGRTAKLLAACRPLFRLVACQ